MSGAKDPALAGPMPTPTSSGKRKRSAATADLGSSTMDVGVARVMGLPSPGVGEDNHSAGPDHHAASGKRTLSGAEDADTEDVDAPPPAKLPRYADLPASSRAEEDLAVAEAAAEPTAWQREGHQSADLMQFPAPPPLPPPIPPYSAHRARPLRESISSRELSYDPATRNADCDDEEGHFIIQCNTIFAQRYRIDRLLGQGTFGRVVQAYDLKKHSYVAIKIIKSIQKYRDASKMEISILRKMAKHDPENRKRCIQLQRCFEYRSHVCLVFELLAESLYDFMKRNAFRPFGYRHVQIFAGQILEAIRYMHSLRMIHTDLKPENLMLIRNDCRVLDPGPASISAGRGSSKSRKASMGPALELVDPDVMLIDFGSSVGETDHHASMVCTRHYRAPEIILSVPWSFPCDIWSLGCILVEMATGTALFQTHDNLEHLALMEVALGPFPGAFLDLVSEEVHGPETSLSSRQFVRKARSLEQLLQPREEMAGHFLDLVRRLLALDPSQRISAHDALRHPFFYC